MYHALLLEQIQEHLPSPLRDREELRPFFDLISKTYEDCDRERAKSKIAVPVAGVKGANIPEWYEGRVEKPVQSLNPLNGMIHTLLKIFHDDDEEKDIGPLRDLIETELADVNQTREELNRNVNLFKTLLANLQSAILVEDENRKILYVNDLFCSFFDAPFGPDDCIGMDCSRPAEAVKLLFKDPQAFEKGIVELPREEEAVYNEIIEMADGRVLKRDYVPILFDSLCSGHFWKYTDITEKVRYEEELQESEERNRLVMNASMDAIITADDTGAIRFWNPQAERLFGWTFEEVAGQQMSDIFVPKNMRGSQKEGMSRYLALRVNDVLDQVLEVSAVNKAGEEFPAELVIETYYQQGKKFFCGFVKDISGRKQAESRLLAQEEKYRNIIDNMNMGLIEVDCFETVLFANQGFCDLLGYSLPEILGHKTSKFLYDHDYVQRVLDKIELRKEGVSDSYEVAVKNKQGELRWLFVAGAPNYNDAGEHIGSIGIHLDITDQKRLKTELESAKLRAEQASVAKESFLANMSHEIRTPLNAIIGMVRELGREAITPTQHEYLSHADIAARHLLSIVNSILDISKIEAGELELDEHDFSLDAVIANLQSILHIEATQKGLALNFQLSPEIWPAYIGDSARIRQILINLLGNAIKFTMEGSVSMNVSVMEEDADAQVVRIKIVDTGIGMDQAYLMDIFSKFSQEERSTSRRFGGTGLGMSITKEIIHLMDGTIGVSSEKGVGTEFVLQLRLLKGDVDRLTQQGSDSEHLLQGSHILLVEDNVMNRFIAKKSLSHFGCTVDEAENGLIALDLLQRNPYDLILMDIQMPELDGIATTKAIRNDLKLATPIVAVTANAFKKDIDLYLSIGMNDYVTKPFEETALFRTLSKQLRKKFSAEETPVYEPEASYDLSALRKLSRGDESFVSQMVDIFVDQTPAALNEIREAMEVKDYLTVAKTAHRIKPSIESMGIRQLNGVAKDIEVYAKSESVDHRILSEKLTFFGGTLDKIIENIRNEKPISPAVVG